MTVESSTLELWHHRWAENGALETGNRQTRLLVSASVKLKNSSVKHRLVEWGTTSSWGWRQEDAKIHPGLQPWSALTHDTHTAHISAFITSFYSKVKIPGSLCCSSPPRWDQLTPSTCPTLPPINGNNNWSWKPPWTSLCRSEPQTL